MLELCQKVLPQNIPVTIVCLNDSTSSQNHWVCPPCKGQSYVYLNPLVLLPCIISHLIGPLSESPWHAAHLFFCMATPIVHHLSESLICPSVWSVRLLLETALDMVCETPVRTSSRYGLSDSSQKQLSVWSVRFLSELALDMVCQTPVRNSSRYGLSDSCHD